MTTVVFIDSEPNALDSLMDAVEALQPTWVIHRVTNGTQALQLVKQEAVDVVVTDTQLADTTGLELLYAVQLVDESIIRLTLSADREAEIVLESARINNRFIAKPIKAEQLVASIDSSLKLRCLMLQKPLVELSNSITSIPALPAIYNEMMKELASANSSLFAVGKIIEGDAGLAVNILRTVNSAFYGLSRRVESVAQAVALLGVHMIKNLTLTAKVFSKFEGSEISLKRLTELNHEAIMIGTLSNQFGRYAKLSSGVINHCQIAGLLCNIGSLIATNMTEDGVENSTVTTQVLGAYVLRTWLMPDSIVEAIALQNDEPPQHLSVITPYIVLYSVRYLQQYRTDIADAEQRLCCVQHLCQYIAPSIAEDWTMSFETLQQLTISETDRAA